MTIWKDVNGKVWNCHLTVKTLKQIKAVLGLDLLDIENSIKKLQSDVYTLCDVLYIVHSDECAKLKITDEDFGGLLVGDCIDEATKALLESLVCFFPKQQREMLEKITNKRQEVQAEIYKKLGMEIDKLDTAEIIKILQKKLGDTFINLQAQQE